MKSAEEIKEKLKNHKKELKAKYNFDVQFLSDIHLEGDYEKDCNTCSE